MHLSSGAVAAKKQSKRRATQARAQATVDTILTGAAQVLEQRGYGSATTDRIAERAGVSVGSIYQYFANKDEIFHQFFDREAARLVAALEEIVSGSVNQDHHTTVRAYLNAGANQEYLTPKIYEELGRVPGLDSKLAALSGALVSLTVELIRPARPELGDEALEILAELLVATSEGVGKPLKRGANPELLDAFVEMIGGYILAENPVRR